ncbi:MAG: DUF2490 domain-containing protein [Acidobacteria bacterium]|nr:DUF2490 domain-containing protein [Acidobacteriota bacterium]
MLRVALLLSLSLGAFGQHDAESMHINNTEFAVSKKAMLQVHTRFRTRDAYREFFQLRFGPILNYNVHKRVTLIGGYYFIEQRFPSPRKRQWEDFNRYFGGASVRLVDRKRLTLDWRNVIERFHTVPGGDYTRVRTRASLGTSFKRVWLPLTSFELLRAQDRFTVRAGAGINRRINREIVAGFGYEMRQYPNRSIGHIVVSNFIYQPGRKE